MSTQVMSCEIKILQDIIEDSVEQTFLSFLGCTPEVVQIAHGLKDLNQIKFDNRSISGSVAFIQDNFEGSLSIRFSRETALSLFKGIYQEDIESVDDQRVIEGIAELANIVHGIVKETLNLRGFSYGMCLPVVVIGKNHTVFATKKSPSLALLFKGEFGLFTVEVTSHMPAEWEVA